MFPEDEDLTHTVEVCWESILIRDRPTPCLLPGEFQGQNLFQSILRVPSQFPLNTPFRFDDNSAQQFVHTCKAQVVQVDHTQFLKSSKIRSYWISTSDSKHMAHVDDTILSDFSALFPIWSNALKTEIIQSNITCSSQSSRIYSHWTTTYTFTTPQHRFTIRVGQCCQGEASQGTDSITRAPLWATFHTGITTEGIFETLMGDYSKTQELIQSLPKDGHHRCDKDHVLQWPQPHHPTHGLDQEIFQKTFLVARSGTVTLSFMWCPINPRHTLILKTECSELVCHFSSKCTMLYNILTMVIQNWNNSWAPCGTKIFFKKHFHLNRVLVPGNRRLKKYWNIYPSIYWSDGVSIACSDAS